MPEYTALQRDYAKYKQQASAERLRQLRDVALENLRKLAIEDVGLFQQFVKWIK